MRRALLRILSFAPAVLLLAAPGNANVSTPLTSFTVSAVGAHYAGTDTALVLELDLLADRSPPSQIALHAPARFALYPDRSEGDPIGSASVELRDASQKLHRYSGTIATAGSEVAPACNTTDALATWIIHVNRVGRPLELSISLVADHGMRLELCPPANVSLAWLSLSLANLAPPRTPGNYAWTAEVTPRDGKTYELRAAVPVPHVLTLRGHYDARHGTAVLTGTLRANRHPRAGVTVLIELLHRTAVPLSYQDAWVAAVETTATGTYRVTVPVSQTEGFIATAQPTVQPCRRALQATPACRSTSISGIESDPVTVSTP